MARLARIVRFAPVGLLAAWLATGAGCVQPLFPEDDDRTPFDSYDAVRNREEPATVYDEYGRTRPNLRGRLSRR